MTARVSPHAFEALGSWEITQRSHNPERDENRSSAPGRVDASNLSPGPPAPVAVFRSLSVTALPLQRSIPYSANIFPFRHVRRRKRVLCNSSERTKCGAALRSPAPVMSPAPAAAARGSKDLPILLGKLLFDFTTPLRIPVLADNSPDPPGCSASMSRAWRTFAASGAHVPHQLHRLPDRVRRFA